MEVLDEGFEINGSEILVFYDEYIKHNVSTAKKVVKAEALSHNVENIIFSDGIPMQFVDVKELIDNCNSDSANPLVTDKVFPGLLILNKESRKIKQVHQEDWRSSIDEEKYDIFVTKRGMSPALTNFFVFLWNNTLMTAGNDTKILFPVSDLHDAPTPDYTNFKGLAFAFEQMSPNPLFQLKKIVSTKLDEADQLIIGSEDSYAKMEKAEQLLNRVHRFAKVNAIIVDHELVQQFKSETNQGFWEVFQSTLDDESNISLTELINWVCDTYLMFHQHDRNSSAVIVYANQLLEQISEFVQSVTSRNLGKPIEQEILDNYFELVSEIVDFIELTVETNNPYLFNRATTGAVMYVDDSTEAPID